MIYAYEDPKADGSNWWKAKKGCVRTDPNGNLFVFKSGDVIISGAPKDWSNWELDRKAGMLHAWEGKPNATKKRSSFNQLIRKEGRDSR